jgi:glycosyltransferase involved in cell wall biosynthesis
MLEPNWVRKSKGPPLPEVSVILNSYNQGRFLQDAITSVLNQTFRDFELIIVDNGSTDNSQALLRNTTDNRIRLFLHDRNLPITRRFNEAIREARAPLVSFLYSDDLYLPTKLGEQVERFRDLDSSYGVVTSVALANNVLTGHEWRLPAIGKSGWVFDALLDQITRAQIDMCSPMVRRSCLVLHPFNESIFGEGEAVFWRISLTHKFSHLDEPLVVLRDHGTNAGKAIRQNASMAFQALDALTADPKLPPTKLPVVRRCRSRLSARYAWQGARRDEDRSWVLSCLGGSWRNGIGTFLTARTFGALLLCSVPNQLRSRVNRRLDMFSGHPGTRQRGVTFGGSADE